MHSAKDVLKVFTLVLLCVSLSGCFETLYHPKIEVIDGKFTTPKGQFEIMALTDVDHDESPYPYNDTPRMREGGGHTYLHGEDGTIYLTLGTLPQYRHSSIITQKTDDNYSFVMNSSSYSLNGVSEKLITSRGISKVRARSRQGHKTRAIGFFFYLPQPLATLDTTMQGGGLRGNTVRKIMKGENDVHRFIFDFSIDEDHYTFDVSFYVKLRKSWTLGLAGTGP